MLVGRKQTPVSEALVWDHFVSDFSLAFAAPFPESNHPVQHAPAKILEVPYLRRNGICKNRICFRIDILLSLLCGISLSYVHGSRPTAVLVVMDISDGYLSYIRELYMNLRCVSCSAGDRSILFCTARTTFSKF